MPFIPQIMNLTRRFHWSLFLLFAITSLPVFAQQAELQNLKHERHTHLRNPKHERVPATEERFFTNREGAALDLTAEKEMFSFAVFGDRTGGPESGVNILADAVRDVNLLEPDLVMTVGDLIQGYNTTKEWMPQMREYRGIMENLICPWFPVAGNHDVYWRGQNRPEGAHEESYETHFGPLWYAFEHKDCFFIVLYSDEGNSETGEKAFRKPASQQMSPEQFAWLHEMLGKSQDAEHVFLFLHHPRWTGDNYGDDWEKVHQELVKAGNVSAVFAGHIHHMRSDARDGIEYITLATTGGHQPGAFPAAGYLHHYNVVTVRENQLGITAYPVGEAVDVRDITPELLDDLQKLSGATVDIAPTLEIKPDGTVDNEVTLRLTNPTDQELAIEVTPYCEDNRWTFFPSHQHQSVPAGAEMTARFRVARLPQAMDEAFAPPVINLATEYLTETSRYPSPVREIPLPFSFETPPPSQGNFALNFNGSDQYLAVPSARIAVEKELTLEAWFKPRSFSERTGLVTKTQGSEYGIFLNDGRPHFSIFLGEDSVSATAPQPMLEAGRWHHVAGVYDGEEVRLYLDGKLVDATKGSGKRRRNGLPLIIGGDVDRKGANSHFNGLIDTVRLSETARYEGEKVDLPTRFQNDEATALLLEMDLLMGDLTYDQSSNSAHASLHGDPQQSARGKDGQ
jgi:hypothetical protein